MSFTNSQFHTSQVVVITDSSRVIRKASTCFFIGASALFLSTALPSHAVTKIAQMAIASSMVCVCDRLDKLALKLKGYEIATNQASETSYQQWLTHSMKPPKKEIEIINSTVEIVADTPNYYDWNNIADEAVGFLICGNSGSAKSSLATWLAGHLSKDKPMGVIALDPHFNDCWKLAGITSIGKIEKIEAALKWLLKELDDRCDRKGEGKPLGDPLFVICDELNAALERFKDKKVVESALKRLGSEGRKFGLTFCGLNQSSNVNAIGIDAKYRSNYALILLGQSARSHAQLGKYFEDIAYPCLLDGSIAPQIAIHPTHGDYKVFKKQGNPPKNLMQIRQLPLPQPLLEIIDSGKTSFVEDALQSGLSPNVAIALDPNRQAIAPVFQKVVAYLDGKEWIRDNRIQQSITEFKNANTPIEEIQGYLQFLEVQGYIETRNAGRNGLEARKI